MSKHERIDPAKVFPSAYTNHLDQAGNPTGGSVLGVGLSIHWQHGPLGRGSIEEQKGLVNGAFVETVIQAVIQRLEFYQGASDGKFFCAENENAIRSLREAVEWLRRRQENREQREVQGTYKP